jgi:hypothetical protein
MALPVLADDTASTTDTDGKDTKDLKKVIEDQGINYVETAQKGITLSGYVDVSYTEQFGGRGTAFGGGASQLHEFDRNNDNFNVQAVKIALEKALPDKNEWAAGFRIDTIVGSDAKFLQDSAFGSSSAFALEQALVKFRIPVGNGLDIYAGKFVTFLGYEVIESPANLNFSRGLLFTNLIPLTHTGVYADYKFNDTVEAKFGVVDGWNNSVSNGPAGGSSTGYDRQNDYPFGGKAITGQINVTNPGKNANICTSFIYSPSGQEFAGAYHDASLTTSPASTLTGTGSDNGPVAVFDIWGNWNPTFVKDSALTLGFNFDFGYNGASGLPLHPIGEGEAPTSTIGAAGASNTWWGAALYASYKFNKVVTLSLRGEYIGADSGSTVNTIGGNTYVSGGPIFGSGGYFQSNGTFKQGTEADWSETVTVAFNIWDNLLTRVEYRFDDIDGNTNGTGHTSLQNEVSLEAVYSF